MEGSGNVRFHDWMGQFVGWNRTSAKRCFRVRGIHELETRQQVLSVVCSSHRWSTTRSSISGGRGHDIAVCARTVRRWHKPARILWAFFLILTQDLHSGRRGSLSTLPSSSLYSPVALSYPIQPSPSRASCSPVSFKQSSPLTLYCVCILLSLFLPLLSYLHPRHHAVLFFMT